MSEETKNKARFREDWEEILPPGEMDLVALNTRIKRNVSNAINHARGLLQTTDTRLTYTKQVTVEILIERGFQSLCEEFERQDQEFLGEKKKNEKVASMERVSHRLADKVKRGEKI